MKKKTSFKKRLISILLCAVLLIGSMPLTAYAATEVSGWNPNMISYSDGVTQYFSYNNYLYQVKYTNLKTITETRISCDNYDQIFYYDTSSSHVSLYASNLNQRITTAMFPKTPGGELNCYSTYKDRVNDTSKPVVIITCIAVNEPTWTWNGTSSATARFTAKDADVFTTANATISSETVSEAENCQTKEQIEYTATVKFNGQTYTDTHTVDGDAGPHDIEYIISGNTITANCKNDGCPSGTGNSVTLNLENVYDYTGNPIPDPVTGGFNHNMATYKVTYNGSEDIPSAVGNYRVALNVYDENGKEKTGIGRDFKIEYLPSPNLSEFEVRGQKYSEMAYGPHWFAPGNTAEVASPDGYMISTMQDGTYEISVSFNADDDKTAYLRRESDGAMTDAINLSTILKWDSDTPTGKITLSTGNIWTHLINEISFGMFFKEAKTAAITAEDTESGVKSVEYYVADHDLINGGNAAALETVVAGNWSTYNDAVSLPLNGKYIVYAKLTDYVGNVSYLSSNGVVIYSDAAAVTQNISTTYRAGEDKEFTVSLNGNTVNAVKLDGAVLSADSDYTVETIGTDPNAQVNITLKSDYLDRLSAGDYTVSVSFNPLGESYAEAEGNEAPAEAEIPLHVAKADLDMSNAKWDYTGPFDYDSLNHWVKVIGLPRNVYAAAYSGNAGAAVGKYTANVLLEYDEDNYNPPQFDTTLSWEIKNDWDPTEYVVSTPNENGWLNRDFVIIPQEGCLISRNDGTGAEWSDSLTVSAESNRGSITFFLKNKESGKISLAETAAYQIDTIPPTGTVRFDEENRWENFLEFITFGLFYPNEVTVSVAARDNYSGVWKTEYASADRAMTLEEVMAIPEAEWTAYEESFNVPLEDAKKFVYFIRITDMAGNVTYLSTDGAVYDTVKPVISGIKNGGTYYTTQKFSVSDTNLEHVAVNEMLISDPSAFILPGNTEAEYVVWAEDKARNTVTFVIHMKPIRALSEPLDNLTPNNVTSDDADILAEIGNAIATENTVNATEEEIAELAATAMHIRALSDTVNAAAEAVGTESVDDTLEVTAENVKLEQQADLEKAKEDLEEALETYGKNYTEEETELIRDAIDRIEGALKAIENVNDIEAVISALPETAAPEDEDAVIAVDSAKMVYGALTANEKALVSAKAKEKLAKLIEAITAYEITEGAGSTWTKGSEEGLTFTANGAFEKFAGIAVNSKKVDAENYEAKAGSTVVTLKASYLETLAAGEYEFAVVYGDGAAEGTFEIAEKPESSEDGGTDDTKKPDGTAAGGTSGTAKPSTPPTGDNSNIALYGAVFAAGLIALAALLLFKKRRKAN